MEKNTIKVLMVDDNVSLVEMIKEYFKNGLTLSYTSMNDYYMCSFRYYLDYIFMKFLLIFNFFVYYLNVIHC